MTYRDSTDDGVEGDIVDDGVEPLYTEWEYEADRLEQRLSFLNTVARLWKHAAITWGGEAHLPERREVLDQWLAQAGANYRQLDRAARSGPSLPLPRTVGLARIARRVRSAANDQGLAHSEDHRHLRRDGRRRPAADDHPRRRRRRRAVWRPDRRDVGRAAASRAGRRSRRRARRVGRVSRRRSRPRQLLYVPHSRGGEPRQVVVTRSMQRLLNDLLGWLPRLGLIRETCQLLDLAQQLESDNPVGQGAVTEFDTPVRERLPGDRAGDRRLGRAVGGRADRRRATATPITCWSTCCSSSPSGSSTAGSPTAARCG